MKKLKRLEGFFSPAPLIVLSATGLVLSGCGSKSNGSSEPAPSTPSAQANEAPFVVRSRSVFNVSTDGSASEPSEVSPLSVSTDVPVTAVNAPKTSMTISTSSFKVPTVTNSVLSFGSVKISALVDNDLNVCGVDGHSACTKAVIRIYTTGAAGAGMWNVAGGYGMPLTAKLGSGTAVLIGLGAANGAVMQSVTIASTKHSVLLADLIPSPTYSISSDFTNAGAGTYSTTMVVEYGLE